MKKNQRSFVVFACLIGGLTFTSALLLALAPAPLTPDAASSLYAVDAPASFDVIFDTHVPPAQGRWKHIFIHHSATPAGNAIRLGMDEGMVPDHFVIGNGDGAVDGEIQVGQRWNLQRPAGTFAGVEKIREDCISICLIGDFDQTVPTPTQVRRLTQLVTTLQGRFRIGNENVIFVSGARGAGGVGKYFPASAFREQILR